MPRLSYVLILALWIAGTVASSGPAANARAAYKPFATLLPIPKVLNGTEPVAAKVVCGQGPSQTSKKCVYHCPAGYALSGKICRPVRVRRITIPIKQADVQILPGKKTSMWTFGGTFPGPTIRVPSGRPLHVKFTNQLDGSTPGTHLTVHLHGGHSPERADGQPHSYFIHPGTTREYVYPLRERGLPERAAFQWYHDHLHEHAERNVWMGLAGMFILDDSLDGSLPLPKGEFDVPLMLAGRKFDENNQLADYRDQPDVQLVNGAPQPYMEVKARKYRLRILNADNSRIYKLHIRYRGEATEHPPQDPDPFPPDALRRLERSSGAAGHSETRKLQMTRIATESGLIPSPQKLATIEVGPGERQEVVVDFSEAFLLQGDLYLYDESQSLPLVEFRRVASEGQDASSVPNHLRNHPFLLEPIPTQVTKEWVFNGTSTINGLQFHASRIDARPHLGRIERWRLIDSNEGHPVHIHGADFLVVSPPDHPDFGLLKETILPRGTVEVAIRFTDHTGRFVLHCHILGHEDAGMMAQMKIAEGRRTPETLRERARPP
jgi:spore coat protein A, manganese oxidase